VASYFDLAVPVKPKAPSVRHWFAEIKVLMERKSQSVLLARKIRGI
jgi:hypothetical protein